MLASSKSDFAISRPPHPDEFLTSSSYLSGENSSFLHRYIALRNKEKLPETSFRQLTSVLDKPGSCLCV
jgi:hypothetical protein